VIYRWRVYERISVLTCGDIERRCEVVRLPIAVFGSGEVAEGCGMESRRITLELSVNETKEE